MKLSKLKEFIISYDNKKGLYRRLFGDDSRIVFLKKFIKQKEHFASNNDDLNIHFTEFLAAAHSEGILFSGVYLNSKTLSATIFKEWQNEPIELIIPSVQASYDFAAINALLNTPLNLSFTISSSVELRANTNFPRLFAETRQRPFENFIEDIQRRLTTHHMTYFRPTIILPPPNSDRYSAFTFPHAAPAA